MFNSKSDWLTRSDIEFFREENYEETEQEASKRKVLGKEAGQVQSNDTTARRALDNYTHGTDPVTHRQLSRVASQDARELQRGNNSSSVSSL